METPPNRISILRKARGWSMASLARLANTTPSTVNKLEKGVMSLTQEWMNRISGALGVGPAELLDEPKPTHVNPKLLSVAIHIAESVLDGEPKDIRDAVIGSYTAAAYDVLVETEAEGSEITDTLINNLIETNRRNWLRRDK